MLTQIHPKLPMRNKAETKKYYIDKLGFEQLRSDDFPDYLMLRKDHIEIHFFLFAEINPKENYGMVYIRVSDIDVLYQSLLDARVKIHPNGSLQTKPWGQKEFSLLDPDFNLLTFGEGVS
ncbi:bleomycin resistance protein [Chryseobacterium caseinilyticum]|uniref:Bleomycin resistance protein n=1 Tax=Chryseobacterium caseinilyticum TaxID=2771428 RepID=A0ABR8Z8F1_9FLAO|nr:VOC family protein [Chryseobacterium caseinilyticum]MBD8081389.1 VOC family protein [Chryseobacterium caseinilyticum]